MSAVGAKLGFEVKGVLYRMITNYTNDFCKNISVNDKLPNQYDPR